MWNQAIPPLEASVVCNSWSAVYGMGLLYSWDCCTPGDTHSDSHVTYMYVVVDIAVAHIYF